MIYADENVWLPVVEGLRRRGWEVRTALEEGTLGRGDEHHLDHARENGWILLTFDDDFLALVGGDRGEEGHADIVYASQHGRDVGELVRRIDDALHRNSGRDVSGEVLDVWDDGRFPGSLCGSSWNGFVVHARRHQ